MPKEAYTISKEGLKGETEVFGAGAFPYSYTILVLHSTSLNVLQSVHVFDWKQQNVLSMRAGLQC